MVHYKMMDIIDTDPDSTLPARIIDHSLIKLDQSIVAHRYDPDSMYSVILTYPRKFSFIYSFGIREYGSLLEIESLEIEEKDDMINIYVTSSDGITDSFSLYARSGREVPK